MAFDIYGGNLRNGYCEVHPHVHEEYPCSQCYAERKQKNDAAKIISEQNTIYHLEQQIAELTAQLAAAQSGLTNKQLIDFYDWLYSEGYEFGNKPHHVYRGGKHYMITKVIAAFKTRNTPTDGK